MTSQSFEMPDGTVVALEIPDEILNSAMSREEQQKVLDSVAATVFALSQEQLASELSETMLQRKVA
jgi:hypothetical protein